MPIHSAMVFADPERKLAFSGDKKSEDRVKGFLGNLPHELTKGDRVRRLSENCWLIQMQSDLQAFCSLIVHARQFQVPTRVLLFESEPQFSDTP